MATPTAHWHSRQRPSWQSASARQLSGAMRRCSGLRILQWWRKSRRRSGYQMPWCATVARTLTMPARNGLPARLHWLPQLWMRGPWKRQPAAPSAPSVSRSTLELVRMPPEVPRPTAGLPGRLIIVEGIDGSGKSTQLDLLRKWLVNQGYLVIFSEWNSSPIVKRTTRRGKRMQLLSPMSFSLIHAADFASRTYSQIMPALQSGGTVPAARYGSHARVRRPRGGG